MYTVLVISIIIVFVVLLLSVVTTSKAYQFKHTVDPIDPLPENKKENEQQEEGSEKNKNQS
ncbi:YtzI protein [Bacillus sp. ISL-47]|uniref:YtzI protein n=1 Tax=Bacillus sp. ISL-47 TaxID=2819130 RepID=UPI001BE65167|nr:YtzI protein [Bacillus sp. ISL-47]MBT2690328.1 YtzI protein [Bacillus sp. ISL-47]MBT2706522.1 YtzI protein [Pseudomonas sp. ISL-84]